jgi:hypothetical protein
MKFLSGQMIVVEANVPIYIYFDLSFKDVHFQDR